MLANSGARTDAHRRIGRDIEAEVLRVTADDRERVHHDAIPEYAVAADNRIRVNDAARPKLRAALD